MREAIERLRMKMNELEQRLREVSRAYEPEEPPVETVPEAQITPHAIEQISEEAEEEIVTVSPIEEPTPEESHIEKRQEKKKRKFF